jgi:DDE family transposase
MRDRAASPTDHQGRRGLALLRPRGRVVAGAAGHAAGRARGSTPRRRPDGWGATAVLRRVRVARSRTVRPGPEGPPGTWSSIDEQQRCSSVRAKRGGALTGPNPTGRGKLGTKYHVVVAADGLPLGAIPAAADVDDTRLLPHRLHPALAVGAAVAKLHADAGCDGTDNRRLCLDQGIQPYMRRIGEAHGSGLGRARSVAAPGCWPTSDLVGAKTGSAA